MSESGAALFVSTFGRGRPMLCLHGVESHGVRFIGLAARLPGIQVVAPDLRGHGRSPKTGPWTIEQNMEDLLPILEMLSGSEQPWVLGHSYGGLLAWELARAAPDLVGALVLVDPAINVDADLGRVSTTYEFSSVGHSWPALADAFAEFTAGRPESGHWSAALDAAVALERGEDGRFRPLVAPDAVLAGWGQMQAPLRPSTYRGPVLLIEAGREGGRFVSAAVIEQMHAQIGSSFSHVVLDATHAIPSDYPDLLAATVARELQATPAV